jgi:hypothetical protein
MAYNTALLDLDATNTTMSMVGPKFGEVWEELVCLLSLHKSFI